MPFSSSNASGSDSPAPFVVGDKVRHCQRPEWGIGNITKVETITLRGNRDQRLWIRFPNAGLKTVLGSVAELEKVDGPSIAAEPSQRTTGPGGLGGPSGIEETLVGREATHEGGWLGAIAKRKPEDAMTSLPATATDPFLSVTKRLDFVLSLFRFAPTGGKLIDWAVAQSGLDDPLSRFNRHQLEVFFERWSYERDLTLHRLVQESKKSGEATALIEARLADASPAVQKALRRFTAQR